MTHLVAMAGVGLASFVLVSAVLWVFGSLGPVVGAAVVVAAALVLALCWEA